MQTAVLGGGPQSTVHRRRFVIAKIRYSQRLVWRVLDFCRSSTMIGKGGEAFVPSFLRPSVLHSISFRIDRAQKNESIRARNADSTDGENPIEFPRGKVILAPQQWGRKMDPRGAAVV